MNKVIIGIDPGNEFSGVIILGDNSIHGAYNMDNRILSDWLDEYKLYDVTVIIEDIKPYSLKMGKSVIDTIKYIGELEYRLRKAEIPFVGIARSEVKQWIFDKYPEMCASRINKRIEYLTKRSEAKGEKGFRNKDGELRKASFIWVDDRVVIEAMKTHWSIPTPKPGKTNRYGISAHAWQALALVSCYQEKTLAERA